MRRSSLVGVVLLVGCAAPELQQQKLADGSLKITCELAMDECIRRAQDACPNQRYRILEGTSETRLRDAPPFERAYHTSRLHLKCTSDGASPLLSLDSPAPGAAPAAAAAPTRVCTTGETRACVGAGACQGGQACLPDGSGFGPCDCGPAPAPAPAGGSPAAPSDAPPAGVAPLSPGPAAPPPDSSQTR